MKALFRFFFVCLIFFQLGAVSFAEPMPGQDHLACARNKNEIIAGHRKGDGIGCFAQVDGFGDGIEAVDYILARRKDIPFVRLQLMWKDGHDFSERDFPFIASQAKRSCAMMAKYPTVKLFHSGACEHRMNQPQAQKLADLITAACPRAEYVNSPLSDGAVLPAYINEIHGKGSPRSEKCAFSHDGTAGEDSAHKHKQDFKGCLYSQEWGPRNNCRWGMNDKTPRKNRTGCADPRYIKSIGFLNTEIGKVGLPNKWIYKALAENHGPDPKTRKPDPKGGYPVFIVPPHVESLVMKTKNGKLVATFPYYGPYKDGRSRYYHYEPGNMLAEKAIKLSGDPVVDVWQGKKKMGQVNPGFRLGETRD